MFANLTKETLEKFPDSDAPFTVAVTHRNGESEVHVVDTLINMSAPSAMREGTKVSTAFVKNATLLWHELMAAMEEGTELYLIIQDHVPGPSAPARCKEWFCVATIVASTSEGAEIYDQFLGDVLAGRQVDELNLPACRVWGLETHYIIDN